MVPSGERLAGRYEVEALLARGGMADVYRGRDLATSTPVAVKVLRPGTADPRRFDRETGLLSRLRHRNLVRLLDAGRRGNVPYLVLELVDGPTLATRLEAGPLAVEEARRVGHDVAAALHYVHGHGVIHRDLKPSNILLAPDDRALLADFGVARLGDGARLTATAVTMGTAAYVAPEQLDAGDVTAAADIYSLGLVLIEAVSGRPAFTGTPHEMLAARLARDPDVPDGLPPSWQRLLRAMTARDPAHRPAAGAVASYLADPGPVGAVVAGSDAPGSDALGPDVLGSSAEAPTEPLPVGTGAAVTRAVPRTGSVDVTRSRAGAGTVAATGTRGLPRDDREPVSHPVRQPVVWLLGLALATLAAMALAVASDDPSLGPGDEPSSADEQADGTAATTTSITAPPATTAPSVPPQQALATTCSDLDAQKQAIDAQKQAVDETYRRKRTREALKQELEEQKHDLEEQKRALGC